MYSPGIHAGVQLLELPSDHSPTAQGVQLNALALLYVPAAHVMQSNDVMFMYDPESQAAVQLSEALFDHSPSLHSTHASPLLLLLVPAVQGEQVVLPAVAAI